MRSTIKTICIELAKFIQKQQMQCFVLNGVDPELSIVGRDLDIYMPNRHEGLRLLVFFRALLKKYGARWIAILPPIWGYRCVGVWEGEYEYFELHIVNSVSIGPLAVSDIFPHVGERRAYGFQFSAWFCLFKQVVMKHVHHILSMKPIWNERTPGKYLFPQQRYYESELVKFLSLRTRFVAVLLGPDNAENLRLRRHALVSLIIRYYLYHPLRAIQLELLSLSKKLSAYAMPCVPAVALFTNFSTAELQNALEDNVSRIFPKIIVSQNKQSWLIRKKLQSRQCLFVYILEEPTKKDLVLNLVLDTRGLSSKKKELEVICCSILDKVVSMNEKWSEKLGLK